MAGSLLVYTHQKFPEAGRAKWFGLNDLARSRLFPPASSVLYILANGKK
jgi:hypothetical protein